MMKGLAFTKSRHSDLNGNAKGRYNILIICALIFVYLQWPNTLIAQNNAVPLDWNSFRQQVLNRHPAAVQANLKRDVAKAYLLKARGGFDLKAYGDFYGKNFNGKDYFTYSEAGLKLPSWLGFEFKGAFNQSGGRYLDPESKLPNDGQVSAGFNWALGQGLLFDQRRADLAQARIGMRAAEAERAAALNDLLLSAAKAYWTWVVADNQFRLYESTLRQAELRLNGLKESVAQGDKPAIDTVETLLQVQIRRLDLNFARVERQNAALELANFLWINENTTLPPDQLPPAPDLKEWAGGVRMPAADGEALRTRALINHPEIVLYNNKLQSLAIERRLKNEQRKPSLDLSYYLLGNGWTFFPTPAPDNGTAVLSNNSKFGLTFSYPLLNRKARGDWQLAQLKIRDAELGLAQKKQAVELKVRQYVNEVANYADQIDLFRELTVNYRLLFDAELEKFAQGESSIFLINTREQRWLDAQLKYQKLIGESQKASAGLLWSAGVLTD